MGKLLALAFAILCLLVIGNALRPAPLVLEIDANIGTSAAGQVFHSRDGSYSEDRSEWFDVVVGRRNIYRIPVAGKLPRSIRLDLGAAPGEIVLYKLVFKRGSREVVLGPDDLAQSIQPLSGVAVGDARDGLAIASLDPDPHFEIVVPESLRTPAWGSVAMASAALLGLLVLAWTYRSWLRRALATVALIRPTLLWPVIGLIGTFAILRITGVGLSGVRPFRSLLEGGGLMIAILAFATIGRAALGVGMSARSWRSFGLAGNALLGLGLLFLYVYLRSLPGALGVPIRITGLEIMMVAVLCGVFLVRRGAGQALTSTDVGLVAFQVTVLFLLCVVVADRELPRLVMLSSDPDSHAFFARQIVHFGGVPRQQGVWGEDSLNYPAGTGVLIALWSWLSMLDVRDSASVASFIIYSLSALALADATSYRASGGVRVAMGLMALLLLFAAYMMPLHASYVHMEGLGRVLAFGFLTLVGMIVLAVCRQVLGRVHAVAILAALLFALASLNPVNVVAGALIVGAGAVWTIAGGRWHDGIVLLLSVFGVALVVVDPYFLGMATGQASAEKLALEGFGSTSVVEGIRLGLVDLSAHPWSHLAAAMEVFPGAPRLASILLLAGLGVTWACILRRRDLWRIGLSAFAVLMVAASALAISQQFGTDKRFFLVAPYLPVALAQVKMLLVMSLSIALVTEIAARRRVAAAAVLAAALVAGSASVIRPNANFFLAPKRSYCGGVECPVQDDIEVLGQFRAYLEAEGVDPDASEDRLLIANRIVRMGRELWLFPAGGGRLAPHADVGPVAFFYFQGDPDYTTYNYITHICERFDISWLREQKVRYVLLPATEGDWCIHDVATLVTRWQTVAISGDARVIDLEREAHVP
ncbi:hypothetical protein [Luteimonas sp. gir]|uniref:hypothetical protein n=1 Tax=Luteimonas sp. gir TaxID=3127960 RepID=UPI003075E2A4